MFTCRLYLSSDLPPPGDIAYLPLHTTREGSLKTETQVFKLLGNKNKEEEEE